MDVNKKNILDNICYTELVYQRINKKLNIKFTREQIEDFIFKILEETDVHFYTKKGKNFYILNLDYKIRITINTNTYRIITVDKADDSKSNFSVR